MARWLLSVAGARREAGAGTSSSTACASRSGASQINPYCESKKPRSTDSRPASARPLGISLVAAHDGVARARERAGPRATRWGAASNTLTAATLLGPLRTYKTENTASSRCGDSAATCGTGPVRDSSFISRGKTRQQRRRLLRTARRANGRRPRGQGVRLYCRDVRMPENVQMPGFAGDSGAAPAPYFRQRRGAAYAPDRGDSALRCLNTARESGSPHPARPVGDRSVAGHHCRVR